MRILIAIAVAVAAVLAWALGPRGRWTRFAAGNGVRDGDLDTIPPAPPAPARRPTSSGNLSEMTRAELYEKAKRLGIPGRSAMTKEQLIRAISARSRAG